MYRRTYNGFDTFALDVPAEFQRNLLTGAAMVREREHGATGHPLAMPVTASAILVSKARSMGLVVLLVVASGTDLRGLVPAADSHRGIDRPLPGRRGAASLRDNIDWHLSGEYRWFDAQFGLLLTIVLIPLQTLSGGVTPRESVPAVRLPAAAVRSRHPRSMPATRPIASAVAIRIARSTSGRICPPFMRHAAMMRSLPQRRGDADPAGTRRRPMQC